METRIYVVTYAATRTARLIRAQNRAHALRYAAKDVLTASVPTQNELVTLLQNGVKVEEPSHAAE